MGLSAALVSRESERTKEVDGEAQQEAQRSEEHSHRHGAAPADSEPIGSENKSSPHQRKPSCSRDPRDLQSRKRRGSAAPSRSANNLHSRVGSPSEVVPS